MEDILTMKYKCVIKMYIYYGEKEKERKRKGKIVRARKEIVKKRTKRSKKKH